MPTEPTPTGRDGSNGPVGRPGGPSEPPGGNDESTFTRYRALLGPITVVLHGGIPCSPRFHHQILQHLVRLNAHSAPIAHHECRHSGDAEFP